MSMLQPLARPASEAGETIASRLQKVHEIVRSRYPAVTRIAIAVYDEKSDQLRTFSSSNGDNDPLIGYAKPLRRVPSLEALARDGVARVVEDIQRELADTSAHSRWLREQGFVCSLTKPLFFGESLVGFLFFDAIERGVFDPPAIDYFALISHLAVELYFSELAVVRTLHSTAKIVRDIVHVRDVETGRHLDRMAHLCRMLGRRLASSKQLTDEFVEHLYLFAPLHDLGKIGIPDSILLKRGRLTDEEFEVMKAHVDIGVQMIERIVANLGVVDADYVQMIRNIILGHHEMLDGSGYPRGLKGDEIPLEARIVSVADVFDATTSMRSYRDPWSNERALDELDSLARAGKLDPDCVAAMHLDMDEIARIQAAYRD